MSEFERLTFDEIVAGEGTVNYDHGIPMKMRAHGIECADGAMVSIQASEFHYCVPRTNYGPYTHVEAGFPTVEPPDSWYEYAEEGDKPLQTVYGYMPVEVAREFIDAHGGEKGA